ncbi:phenylalanyl-tRNA synthetase alpha subunit, mitochondrial [Clarireedia jacksonii]
MPIQFIGSVNLSSVLSYTDAFWVASSSKSADTVTIAGKTYKKDDWCNLSGVITNAISRNLHTTPDHPISITRSIIESKFPAPTYKYHNTFFPIVSTHQNFDSLGFPPDHPGRSKTDTYYVNKETVLRTHTSAHQADTFRRNESKGFLISADVYRRDAIDRSHYPIFHQMEGARMWDRTKVPKGDVAAAVWKDIEALPKHDMKVEDPNPAYHAERNPVQEEHTAAEAEAIAAHLKRSLELMVVDIFSRAKEAAMKADPNFVNEPLKVRWIEAYFPFTSPSWELEIFWQGDWLEVLGCGVVTQEIMKNAGVPDQLGWAFGLGLERIAMLLFEIPDIRLFWSKDERFLSQFHGISENLQNLKRFVPFSKYPACPKDVAFWLRSSSSAGGGGAGNVHDFHENDIMEIVRDVGGDMVEDVSKVDEFTHPKTGRKSLCYRVNYRSLEKTLTNEEANALHEEVRTRLVSKFGVELSMHVAHNLLRSELQSSKHVSPLSPAPLGRITSLGFNDAPSYESIK